MALLKAVLLLAAALLFAAILLQNWLRDSRLLGRLLGLLAVALIVGGSLLDIRQILASLPVNLDVWSYLTATRHGLAVRWRIAVSLVLLVFMLLPVRRWQPYVLVPGWLGLLYTFSFTSHAAAMAGSAALVTDFVHFVAAGVWAGMLAAVSLAVPLWHDSARGQLIAVMRTVSVTGLISVLVIAASGSISSLFHLAEPETFFGSGYSWALLIKIVLVVLTVAVAAFNRFLFLPRLQQGSATGLRRSLLLESLLLVAVFAATGLLTTSSLPHGQDFPGVGENLNRLIEFIWR